MQPSWLSAALRELEQRHLRRELASRAGPQGASIVLEGRECLNFGSNDYLGIANDPRVAAAAIEAIRNWGWGSAASPLVTGRSDIHAELERELATFEHTESALLFPTGFAANVGVITSLVGSRDIIFSDARNHASIIDGCRLSGAMTHIYRHGSATHLHELVQQFRHAGARCLIVTDGLFSMDGDLAPLVELAMIAEQADAMLLVDEAHATGVWGPNGRGTVEHFQIESLPDCDAERIVRVGTLSKAMGSIGGFVVGGDELVSWIANQARPFIFSTALPAACCAAALAALRIIRDEPYRRTELLERSARLHATLIDLGFTMSSPVSQILPIHIGDPARTMALAKLLVAEGVFVPGIRPPSVPVGGSLLRLSLSYSHGADEIERLVSVLRSAIQSPNPFELELF